MTQWRRFSLGVFLVVGTGAARAQLPDGTPDRGAKPPTLDPEAIALAPFAVRGPSTLAYLSDAVPELFQTALDGAQRHRVVQTPAARRQLRELADPTDLSAAAAVARSHGAGLVLGGSIVSTNGADVQLNAELYDAVAGRQVRRATARNGELGQLRRMVDSLTSILTGAGPRRSAGTGAIWGTLVDAGRVKANQTFLMTDFRSTGADSTVATLARDALATALQQTGFVRIMSPQAVADALTRMRLEPTVPVTLARAKEMARREGAVAIIDGEVRASGPGATLFVTVIAADSGTVLTVVSQPLGGTGDLLEAIDALARRIRSKIGESLATVQSAPPLEKVTTASTEALLHFTRGERAAFVERDLLRAVEEYKKAVTIDTSFAAAWRRLGPAAAQARNTGVPVEMEPRFRNPVGHAFANRHHATEAERLVIEGTYYSNSRDIEKARVAYESYWALTGEAPANLGIVLNFQRKFARAESLFRIAFRDPGVPLQFYGDLISSLMNQGKDRAADSLVRVTRQRSPDDTQIRLRAAQVACGRRLFSACDAMLDSLIASGAPNRAMAIRMKAVSAVYRGQVARSRRLESEIDPPIPDSARGTYQAVAVPVEYDLRIFRRPDRALAMLVAIRDTIATGNLMTAARNFAGAGAPDRARALLERFDQQVPEGPQTQGSWLEYHAARADIAQAEGRWADAIAAWKEGDVNPVDRGPAGLSTQVMPFGIAVAYDSAHMRDSAIYWYERSLATPMFSPMMWHPAMRNPPTHERLAQLYAAAGNRAKAVEHYQKFIDLWKDADPELQPRVVDARARLAQLRSPP